LDKNLRKRFVDNHAQCIKEYSEIELTGSDSLMPRKFIKIMLKLCSPKKRNDCYSKEEIGQKLKKEKMTITIDVNLNYLDLEDIENPYRSHYKRVIDQKFK
jgi:hypothetical protein